MKSRPASPALRLERLWFAGVVVVQIVWLWLGFGDCLFGGHEHGV